MIRLLRSLHFYVAEYYVRERGIELLFFRHTYYLASTLSRAIGILSSRLIRSIAGLGWFPQKVAGHKSIAMGDIQQVST